MVLNFSAARRSCGPGGCWQEGATLTDVTDVASLRSLVAAFNAHDLDQIMAYFTDDCVLETPRGPDVYGTRFTGRDAVREGLAGRFAGLPDVHYGEDEHWAVASTPCRSGC